jgi:hypothetical protein
LGEGLSFVAGTAPALADESPRSWIDPDTGLRIVPLSQDERTSDPNPPRFAKGRRQPARPPAKALQSEAAASG